MLLDRLKTSALAKHILIFVVTRQAKIGLEEKSTSKGAAEFLNKPIEKDAFVNTVHALPTAPTQSPVPLPTTIHTPTWSFQGAHVTADWLPQRHSGIRAAGLQTTASQDTARPKQYLLEVFLEDLRGSLKPTVMGPVILRESARRHVADVLDSVQLSHPRQWRLWVRLRRPFPLGICHLDSTTRRDTIPSILVGHYCERRSLPPLGRPLPPISEFEQPVGPDHGRDCGLTPFLYRRTVSSLLPQSPPFPIGYCLQPQRHHHRSTTLASLANICRATHSSQSACYSHPIGSYPRSCRQRFTNCLNA